MTDQTFNNVTVTLKNLPSTLPGSIQSITLTMQQGVQADRIADALERFSVNCFSQHDVSWNPWGAWPEEYTAATTIAGLQAITGSSGYTINLRAFYYAGRETQAGGGDLAAWCPTVYAATGAKVSIAIGQGGGLSDAQALATWLGTTTPAWLGWLEGINEPNGVAPVALADTESAQAALPACGIIMGPSVVIGMPNPEGWISSYLGANGAANILAHASVLNVHYYPSTLPTLDDGSARGGEMADVLIGIATGWASQAPEYITEWHPNYYNAAGNFSGGDTLAAYYALIYLFEAYLAGFAGYAWFSLFDFSTTPCGLFGQSQDMGGNTILTAKAPATALANLFGICGPAGAAKQTFTPGSLDYTVTGLPAPINSASPKTGGRTALFQRDDGVFLLMLWNAQVSPGGTPSNVTVSFGTAPTLIEDFLPASSSSVQHTFSNAATISVSLAAEFHVLRITP